VSGTTTHVPIPAPGAPSGRPAWLREYLLAQPGSTHALTVRLEPFVAWLGADEPASVSPAALIDLYGFWASELGPARTRTVLEAVADVYSWLRTNEVPGAAHLLGLTDDYLKHRLPRADEPEVAAPKRKIRLRGGLADVFAACGMMLLAVVLVMGGWALSSPATIVAGGGFAPVLPLVGGMAVGGLILVWGFVFLLRAARGLGTVPMKTGAAVLSGIALFSLAFCVVGAAGALEMMGMGSLVYALPFIVVLIAGLFGAATVAQAVVPLVQAVRRP
jgi:hypothetical protein